jgi:hypothetical protein
MSFNPARNNAMRSYWASVQRWADGQGLKKEEVHSRLKEKMGFDHIEDITTKQLMEMAYEIGTMADGGPGL